MTPFWLIATAVAAAIATALLVPGPPDLARAERGLGADDADPARPLDGRQATASVSPVPPRLPPQLPIRRRMVWGLAAGLGLAAAVQGALGWLAAVIAPVVFVGVVLLLGRLEPAGVRRRRWSATVQAPQVLDLMAAGLQAGLPLRAVTAGVAAAARGPIVDELERVHQLVELGTTDVDAWRSLADHLQLGPVALDLSRSVDSGSRLAEALSVHAAEARQARRAALEVEARKVGVRSVLPLMTCFIPAFLLLGVVPTVASALARGFAALG